MRDPAGAAALIDANRPIGQSASVTQLHDRFGMKLIAIRNTGNPIK
ncbi:MAG: hypothetical protein NVSMB6_14580 [Burkholderiaceae bacterium]